MRPMLLDSFGVPALWATGGLAIVTNTLAFSLPSPRAFDLTGLDDPEAIRTHTATATATSRQAERTSERSKNLSHTERFPLMGCWGIAKCFVGSGENDKTQISFIFYLFNYASGRASPGSIEKCKSSQIISPRGKRPDETDVA